MKWKYTPEEMRPRFKIDRQPDRLSISFKEKPSAVQGIEWSIAKYEFVLAWMRAKSVKTVPGFLFFNGNTCGCCLATSSIGCSGCPILEFTGQNRCLSTPWHHKGLGKWNKTDVQRELTFLRKLLKWYEKEHPCVVE